MKRKPRPPKRCKEDPSRVRNDEIVRPGVAPRLGARIEVDLSGNGIFYKGTVDTKLPRVHHKIRYDDGEVETIFLPSCTYRPVETQSCEGRSATAAVTTTPVAVDAEICNALQFYGTWTDELDERMKKMPVPRPGMSFDPNLPVKIGDRLEIYWPDDDKFYRASIIAEALEFHYRVLFEKNNIGVGIIPLCERAWRFARK